MHDIKNGIITILIGVAAIIFRKWIADGTIDARNRMFAMNLDEKTKVSYRWVILLLGLFLIIYGTLTLFGVVK